MTSTALHVNGSLASAARRLLTRYRTDLLLTGLLAAELTMRTLDVWTTDPLSVLLILAVPAVIRWPVWTFPLVLLVVWQWHPLLPPPIALGAMAEKHHHPAVVGAAVALYALAEQGHNCTILIHGAFWQCYSVISVPLCYSLVAATAGIVFGKLLLTRRDLSSRMAELTEAHARQRTLHAETVLSRERAKLAREMHDVVSHQVSLIAVRAGALQVSADAPATREAARTIRTLSATTLDELRHMVTLLRASDSHPTGLCPQPTLDRLHLLVSNSGLDVALTGDIPDDASPAVQRAAYRTIQEALTNIRKHAPGSTATITLRQPGPGLDITVTNTAPELALPSSQQGLIGLRERAENLGGTLIHGPTADGGYHIHTHLPHRTP
ncbi:sensor histidine kinase [Streptomyces hundungensis]|uniref:sensor histidine kinase n=1 Tax=Streptomyces hundungensis TaxID=1077946 RepID=UPI0031EDAC73